MTTRNRVIPSTCAALLFAAMLTVGALAQEAPVAPEDIPIEDTPAAEAPPAARPEPAPKAAGVAEAPPENGALIGLEAERGENLLIQPGPGGEDLINVTVENETLENVVNMFTRISGANIVATSADLEGTVTVNLKNVRWRPALSSILDVHNLALVEKTPGSEVFSIVAKPPRDQEPLKVDSIFLHYTTVEELAPIVNSMLAAVTNASMSQFPSRNAMIIRTTEANVEEIKQLVEKMDVPSKQVCVETQFMELNDEAGKQLGIRWDSLAEFGLRLNAGPFSYNRDIERVDTRDNQYTRSDNYNKSSSRSSGDSSGVTTERLFDVDGNPIEDIEYVLFDPNPNVDGDEIIQEKVIATTVRSSDDAAGLSDTESRNISETTSQSVMDTFTKTIAESQAAILDVDSFQMVLSALKKTDGVTIVSNPKIIVTSGSEDAFFSVGEREPIIKTEIQYGTQDSPGDKLTSELDTSIDTDYIRQGYLETGINLKVIPVVKTEEMIQAFIAPKLVRRLLPDKVVGENSWPRISVKEIQTRFTLRSGQTVAIGGLTSTQDQKKISKVPLFGDIPLIGKYLFSHTQEFEEQVETIIFVTLSLAEPETLYREAGIPERAELVHKHLIQNEAHRKQLEKDLQMLREASQEVSEENRAKSRLLKRRQ